MKRSLFLLALAVLAACEGDPTSGAEEVRSVQVLPDARTLAVGETLPLEAVVRDAGGDEPGAARLDDLAWTSDAPGVASVSRVGVVTGVAPGTATIRASLDGQEGSVTVTVAPAPAACTVPAVVRTLGVGEAVVLGGVTASVVCLSGGAGGAEFVAVPFHAGDPDEGSFAVTLSGQGIATPPPFARAPAAAPAAGPVPDEGFHARLRTRAARELAPYWSAALSRSPRRQGPRPVLQLGTPVAEGQRVVVNTSLETCDRPRLDTGVVMAVRGRAVVLADVRNPAGGLTADEYRSFAAAFDTLIYPRVTATFGEPQDVDGNGQIVIFYTRSVNELTPANSSAYVGGYFHPRDLFPTRSRDGLAACAGSNFAELFYLLVPDPNGTVNGNRFSRELILKTTLGTLAHEFQHLINASRRLYVVETSDWNEVPWLNEGLSHISEEVVFFHTSGLGPRQNLSAAQAKQAGVTAQRNPFETYLEQNFKRLDYYLAQPSTQSPYDGSDGDNDDLATRGAAWSFLRYAADRRNGDDVALWKGLVDSDVTGLANLQRALGTDPRPWVRDWAVGLFTDEVAASRDFSQPSYRLRQFFSASYPLVPRTLSAAPYTASIKSGGSEYFRFSVLAGQVGTVNARSGNALLPSRMYMTVVRTR